MIAIKIDCPPYTDLNRRFQKNIVCSLVRARRQHGTNFISHADKIIIVHPIGWQAAHLDIHKSRVVLRVRTAHNDMEVAIIFIWFDGNDVSGLDLYVMSLVDDSRLWRFLQ